MADVISSSPFMAEGEIDEPRSLVAVSERSGLGQRRQVIAVKRLAPILQHGSVFRRSVLPHMVSEHEGDPVTCEGRHNDQPSIIQD